MSDVGCWSSPAALASASQGLQLCARQQGHAITINEVVQAFSSVRETTPLAAMCAAWHQLFPAEQLIPNALTDVRALSLPALVWHEGRFSWLTQQPSAMPSAVVLVPLRLMPDVQSESVSQQKPATQAIKQALQAHAPIFKRVTIATLLINLLAIMTSLFAMQVYDRVVPNFAYATLWVLTLGIVIALVFDFVFKWVRLLFLETLSRRADAALSQFFFERLMAMKVDRRPAKAGTLVSQVRDYEAVKAFFTSTTLFAIADLPFALLFMLVIALLGGYVALVPLAFMPLCFAIGWLVQKPLSRFMQQQTDESARRHGILIDVIQGAESVKALHAEWRFGLLWEQLTRVLAGHAESVRRLSAKASFLTGSFQQLAYVLILVVGVYRIEAGALTMGGLIACSILGSRVLAAVAQITPLLVQWQQAKYALSVLDNLLVMPRDAVEEQQASALAVPLDIQMSSLTYAYDASAQICLRVPQLQIRAGERVAVIGRNGSGKSTLLRLLAGLATPSTGVVSLAGVDMQKSRQAWLRQSIGYLPQDVRLFAGTLRDNLLLGIASPEPAQLQAALARTGLKALVEQLPEGLDCLISEGGSGFSGGQRQLICITRLLLQQPSIWMLDEPSASLDSETEALLMSVIRELPAEITVIFTTHRKSWLALSTRILVVEGGGIRRDVASDALQSSDESAPATGSVQ